jgi:glycosyltransferase involved in cell wall biosynthesis
MSAEEKAEGGRRTREHIRYLPGLFPPLVSIIMATFNAAKVLERGIHSVLEQTYKNIEFIIVDGGSTDATLDIIRKYDDRIDYWISEKDEGVYDAFNKGIDIANGDWLFFLGADDSLANDSVLQRFFSKPIDSELLYGNVLWGEGGEIVAGEFFPEKFYSQNICQQAIFYNKNLFERIGKFDLKYRLVADWVLNMKAFGLKTIKPVYFDTVVAVYSLGGMSTNVWDEEFLKNREKLYRKSFGIFAYLNFKVSSAIEKALIHSPKLRAVISFFTVRK